MRMRTLLNLMLTAQPVAFYRKDAFWVMAVSLFIMLFLIVVFIILRRKFDREIVYQRKIARSYERELMQQRKENQVKEDELHRQEQRLAHTQSELERVTIEIENYKSILKEKEQMLEDIINQNKSFMRLLHQTKLEGSAQDVVDAVRRSSEGRHEMSDEEWKQLLLAVDKLYPDFTDMLIRKLGRVDRQELRVCYLIRIGLSNPQIQNITNLPRTTVWRWTKKYEWIAELDKTVSPLPASKESVK